MAEMPEITEDEITAVYQTMKTVERLHEYAEDHPDDALSAERLELIFNYVEGLHSTLSMIYVSQED